MIAEKILQNCKDLGEKVALRYLEKSITYCMLENEIKLCENLLSQYPLQENEPIGVMFDNTPEIICWILACFQSQHPVALIPSYFKDTELNYHLQKLHLRLCVVQNEYVEYYPQSYIKTEKKRYKILFKEKNEKDFYEFSKTDRIIQFTSGSQGKNKAIVRSEHSLYEEIVSLREPLRLDTSNPNEFAPLTPIYHAYGLIVGALFPLFFGASIFLTDVKFLKKSLEFFEKYKVNYLFTSPYIYMTFNQILKTATYDLKALQHCFSAGADIQQSAATEFFEVTGNEIYQIYGATEVGIMAVGKRPLRENRSLGCFLGDAEVKIDFFTADTGELLLKNKILDFYYLYPKELNKSKFVNGFYKTGDLVKKDHREFFYISRCDNCINVNGLKFYPDEIEEVIRGIEGVQEVVVLSEQKDEACVIKAVVALKPNSNCTEYSIRKFCKLKLADYKVPKYIQFVEKLPRNATGKILKKDL